MIIDKCFIGINNKTNFLCSSFKRLISKSAGLFSFLLKPVALFELSQTCRNRGGLTSILDELKKNSVKVKYSTKLQTS